LSKSSALLSNNNPHVVTAGYRIRSDPVTSATLGHPGSRAVGWFARIIRLAGDLIFMANDEEAYWRGWTVERRLAGLGRRYRDPLFDTLATCPHCRGLGITATESLCVTCSGAGRVTIIGPPFAHDG
jgi:hypothetical protein